MSLTWDDRCASCDETHRNCNCDDNLDLANCHRCTVAVLITDRVRVPDDHPWHYGDCTDVCKTCAREGDIKIEA